MPSSGRFQSRVLSEISRQSLKLRDRLERLGRQARIAATWSAQVLLYPIYVGFQSLRMASRQLSQASHSPTSPLKALVAAFRRVTGQPTSPPAKPLSASTPIRRALAAVEELGLPLALSPADEENEKLLPGRQNLALLGTRALAKKTGTSAIANTSTAVRALASSLETRSLVLVSPENEILDVLTPDQHDFLRRRIADALADYWRDRREFALAKSPVLPLPLPPISENLLPPVKWFYQLMAWEQRSAVAIAVDLFQEATLAFYFSVHEDAELILPGEVPPSSQGLVYSPSRLPVVAAAPGALLNPEAESSAGLVVPSGQSEAVVPYSPESKAVSTQMESNALQPYIEAQVQLVAYEQHPLERLLQWLDRGMLWLENQVARLQNWWKQFQR